MMKCDFKDKIDSGEFTFTSITEDDTLTFNPPLKITWNVWREFNEGTKNIWAYVQFDFGMTKRISVEADGNFLIAGGYEGLTKNSSYEDIVKKVIQFHLFHALTHTTQDPNYSHFHWALAGWLKGRVKVTENNEN